MHAINGKFKNGQIVLDEEANWPEDTKVRVEPITHETTLGIRDGDWPTDPEGIAKLIALVDSLEPFLMTEEEDAEWRAALQAQKEYDKAHFEERAKRIEGMFE